MSDAHIVHHLVPLLTLKRSRRELPVEAKADAQPLGRDGGEESVVPAAALAESSAGGIKCASRHQHRRFLIAYSSNCILCFCERIERRARRYLIDGFTLRKREVVFEPHFCTQRDVRNKRIASS